MTAGASLTVTVGLPGSGKSTWAFGQEGAVVVERDEIRRELTGDVRNHSREGAVTAIQHQRVTQALRDGRHVIVSDTNLKGRYRQAWRTLAEMLNADYHELSFLDVPIETCIERDAQRDQPVGETVIRRMQGAVS